MSIQYAVFFDMDGTLLQTEKLSTPAFKQTFEDLREQKLWNAETPSDDQLTNVLGMTLNHLWETLLPNASQEVRDIADKIMLDHEVNMLKEDVTDLYPGVRETLQALTDNGIAVFVASNGLEVYIDAICEHFKLKEIFTDLYSAGRFQTKSKNDLVAKLIRDYDIKEAVMVGDRKSDVEAGRANHLFTIGCDFGFAKPGELNGASVVVTDFFEVLQHIPFLKSKPSL